jgi:adenosylhomocysteine nucleosidase
VTLPHPIVVVTGLAREARIAAGPDVAVVAGLGSPALMRKLEENMLTCRAVVSFGIAGGLDPTLAPGDVVIATGVQAAGSRWRSDTGIVRLWAQLLDQRAERVILADIAGVEIPLLCAGSKRALRAATGAAVVDMESHMAAELAAARGLPFAAIRVVCDPAERTLPSLAAKALRPDGRVDVASVLASLLRRPVQITALPRLARDARLAFARLGSIRATLGPDFSLGLLGLSEPLGDVL